MVTKIAVGSSAWWLSAIPGGLGQAGNDRIPRVIIGGGIGDELGKEKG